MLKIYDFATYRVDKLKFDNKLMINRYNTLKAVLDVAVEKLRINEQEKKFSSQSCLALSSSKASNKTNYTFKLNTNRNSNNIETMSKNAIRNGMGLKSSSTTDWSQLRDRQNIITNNSNLSNKLG